MNSASAISAPLRSDPRAFALVSVLAILALILVLVLSISSVLHVETRTSASGKNLLLARQNALLGLDTAISQLQQYAGKDQAVTFPATTFYPTKDMNLPGAAYPAQGKGEIFDNTTFGFRKFAQTSSKRSYLDKVETYLTPKERTEWNTAIQAYWNTGNGTGKSYNPYWTGIMDASLRVDRATNPNDAPAALPAQQYGNADGDSTWGESNDYETKFGEPKRDQLPVWLVSGNEKFTITGNTTSYPSGYYHPDEDLLSQINTDPYFLNHEKRPEVEAQDYAVELVGNGTVSSTANSTDGLEPRVKVKKVSLQSTSGGNATGHYAYWVADESTKANFAVRDPYFDAAEGSVDYRNRLQSPQRLGWENLTGMRPQSEGGNATFSPNDPNLENITTSKEIALLEKANTQEIFDATKNNFHSLTAFSRSLLTDTALGGIKKDLTAYLERGDGLTDADSIANRSLYETTGGGDARFRAWGGNNTGFPVYFGANATDGLPLWGTIRDWYQNTSAGGNITPDENTAPVLTYFMMQAGMSYNPTTKELNWHWLPVVTLWNPYDVGLESATYELEVEVAPNMWKLFLANKNPTLAELQKDTGAEWAMRAVGPIDPVTGTRANVKSFKGTEPNPDFPDGDPLRNYWPVIEKSNPKYAGGYSGNGTTADYYNVGGLGPFAFDNDITDGTSDGFGRRYYYLTKVSNLDEKIKLVGKTGGRSTVKGTNKNGPLGAGDTMEFRFNPHGDDTNPMKIKLRFSITSSFGPGESLIFSYQNTSLPEWDPLSTDAIPLQSGMDLTEPPSIWFPVLNVVNGPDSSDGLVFLAEGLTSKVSPKLTFNVNGKKIMTALEFGGTNNWFGVRSAEYSDDNKNSNDFDGDGNTNEDNNTNDQSKGENGPKYVNQWRTLYSFSGSSDDEFNTKLTGVLQKAGPKDSPIWSFGESYLTPFTNSQGSTGGIDVESYMPAFSRFNLGAKTINLHPLLDRIRDVNGINNFKVDNTEEGLKKLVNIQSTGKLSPWDNNQSDGDKGFSLVTFQNVATSPTYKALSDLPIRLARRPTSNILSLGQLQQVNLSPYLWQPSFPIGNSWAGVYNDREAIAGIHSRIPGLANVWVERTPSARPPQVLPNSMSFSFTGKDKWGNQLPTIDVDANSMLDISYLLNENLWDRYFLSTQKNGHDPKVPLANSRLRFTPEGMAATSGERQDFDTAGALLENVGALNVNSTSVEAWKALLSAFRDLSLKDNPANTVPIARSLDPIGGNIKFTFTDSGPAITAADIGATSTSKDYATILSGFRYLTDDMLEVLAQRIVDEVRLRGPFLSMSDFVNRRLVAPQGSRQTGSDWYLARTNGWSPLAAPSNTRTDFMNLTYDPFIGLQGLTGPIQRALDVSGINGGVNHPSFGAAGTGTGFANDSVFTPRVRNTGTALKSGADFTNTGIGKDTNDDGNLFTVEPARRSHLDTEHLAGAPAGEAGHLLQGAPGFVTQGDILAMLGPALTPRGDTFLVRAYGDAVDKNGKVLARAYLEAVVQRVAEPVTPQGTSGAAKWTPTDAFGRKFKVVSLRWLNPEEV